MKAKLLHTEEVAKVLGVSRRDGQRPYADNAVRQYRNEHHKAASGRA